jgi:hypothetical protein
MPNHRPVVAESTSLQRWTRTPRTERRPVLDIHFACTPNAGHALGSGGFPYDQRVARFEEAFTIIRQLVRTGRSDFRGAYYEVADCVCAGRSRASLTVRW